MILQLYYKFKKNQLIFAIFSTFKMDCPFKIKFLASKDGNFLEIAQFCDRHEGHELSEKVYEHLSQVRKLNKDETEEIANYFEIGGNAKMVQNKLRLEKGKKITLKDLSNIKWKSKQSTDDLSSSIQLLKEEYKADVRILQDEDKNFKALYFSTANMRHSMSQFPDIVFIDGTYKLLNNVLILMLLIVEDSNGLSEVAGVSLIVNEDYDTFKWFLMEFRNDNEEAANKIKCFMADKDLLERNVIKEVFQDIPVYICIFHTLKTFRRNITYAKFQLSKAEQTTCLEFLNKLVYSNSEENYEEIYKMFCDTCPQGVVEYFNKNWHNIRSEWTCFSMVHGNLKNRTNNRLESLNQKIKAVVPLHCSLHSFLKYFLNWLNSHNEERNSKVAKIILKRPVTKFCDGSSEKKYLDFLTPYAYNYVLKQCVYSKNVVLNPHEGKYQVNSNGAVFTVGVNACDCPDFSSMLLPCRHILALRRNQGLDLFCEETCAERWRKSYYLHSHRALGPNLENVSTSSSVTSISRKKIMNPTEKRKRVNAITNSLVNLVCLSTDSQFEYKLECLKKIELLWRQGSEVKIGEVDDEIDETINQPEEIYSSHLTEDNHSNSSEVQVDELSIGPEEETTTALIDSPMQNNFDGQRNFPRDSCETDVHMKIDLPQMMDNSSQNDENMEYFPSQNKKDSEVIEISEVIMPSKIIKHGRPRGSELTAIGLKKRRKVKIPVKFVSKSDIEKKEFILKEMVSDELTLTQTLLGEYKIEFGDLKTPESFRHCLFDQSIELNLIRDALEPNLFSFISQFIEEQRENHEWCCNMCQNPLIGIKSICCDSCLMWFHFQCVGLTNISGRRTWFCRDCY